MRIVLLSIALVSVASAETDGVLPEGVGRVEWHGVSEFTPNRTRSGSPLRWPGACVFLRPNVAGAADVDLGLALRRATSGWELATRGCGYLAFRIEEPGRGEVAFDHVSRIIVREERWCRPGPPELCHDPSAIGLTSVFFVDKPGDPMDGVILDADIELNAVDFALATCDSPGTCTTRGEGPPADLIAILTHELGHAIGLDHTCWAGAEGEAPLDGNDVPLRSCFPAADLPFWVKDATMYNFSSPGENKKRTPEADDVNGFCRAYPRTLDPGACVSTAPPDQPEDQDLGCCRASGPDGSLALALLALLPVGARRRRVVPSEHRAVSGRRAPGPAASRARR